MLRTSYRIEVTSDTGVASETVRTTRCRVGARVLIQTALKTLAAILTLGVDQTSTTAPCRIW